MHGGGRGARVERVHSVLTPRPFRQQPNLNIYINMSATMYIHSSIADWGSRTEPMLAPFTMRLIVGAQPCFGAIWCDERLAPFALAQGWRWKNEYRWSKERVQFTKKVRTSEKRFFFVYLLLRFAYQCGKSTFVNTFKWKWEMEWTPTYVNLMYSFIYFWET